MAKINPTPGEYRGPIPGHVAEIIALAKNGGLRGDLFGPAASDDEEEQPDLVVQLSGTEDAFRASGLVPRGKFRFPVRYCKWHTDLFRSELVRLGRQTFEARVSVDFPLVIARVEDGVEQCDFPDDMTQHKRRSLWGAPRQVERVAGLKAGAIRHCNGKRRPRTWVSGCVGSREWNAQFYPSGNVLYTDSEERPGWREELQKKENRKWITQWRATRHERDATFENPEKFASSCERWLLSSADVLIMNITGELERKMHGECTIRYDDKTVETVKAALEHACQILQSASPGFVGRKVTEARRAKIAEADPEFRSFLSRLIGPNGGAQ